MDFVLQYKESPAGESPYITYDKNNNRAGLLGLLYRQEADLACFGTGLGNERYYAADALISHTQDSLVWMAPAPGLRSNWDSVYIAFSTNIWILVLVFLITIGMTFRYLSANTDDVLFSDISKCILDSWSATLNLGITSRPKSQKMKCFLTFVLLYAVIISAAYQSFLITLLTSHRKARGFNTIEEAVDAGIVAYVFPSGMYMYNQSNHRTWNKILAEGGHVFDTSYNYTKTLFIVVKPPYAVSLMIQYSADFIVRKYFLRHSGPLARALSPFFTTYPITFYMSPGHPLRYVINEKVARLMEAGLPEKWLQDVLRDAEDRDYGQGGENDDERKALSLAHLEVTFLILGFGLTISLIGFILEVIAKKSINQMLWRPSFLFSQPSFNQETYLGPCRGVENSIRQAWRNLRPMKRMLKHPIPCKSLWSQDNRRKYSCRGLRIFRISSL